MARSIGSLLHLLLGRGRHVILGNRLLGYFVPMRPYASKNADRDNKNSGDERKVQYAGDHARDCQGKPNRDQHRDNAYYPA
jgi:hypothetical protein